MTQITQNGVTAVGQRKKEVGLTVAVRSARGRTVYVEVEAKHKSGGPSKDAVSIVKRRKNQPVPPENELPAQQPAASAPENKTETAPSAPAERQKKPAAPEKRPEKKPAAPVAPNTKASAANVKHTEAKAAAPLPPLPQDPRATEKPARPVRKKTPIKKTQPEQAPTMVIEPISAPTCNIDDLPTEAQLRKALSRLPASNVRKKVSDLPEEWLLRAELNRFKYRQQVIQTVRNVISTLITVSATAVLIAVLILPVLRIYGSSMTPTLREDQLVVCLKGSRFETGEVVAFYYNNKILIKRVIARAGQWVDIDENGNVYVDHVQIDEPYLGEKAFGECDIDLPYQVPENRIFVMGDQRAVSVDSRSTTVGCVAEEQIVGRVVFRIWPLKEMGDI